jgi:hypothetical protein
VIYHLRELATFGSFWLPLHWRSSAHWGRGAGAGLVRAQMARRRPKIAHIYACYKYLPFRFPFAARPPAPSLALPSACLSARPRYIAASPSSSPNASSGPLCNSWEPRTSHGFPTRPAPPLARPAPSLGGTLRTFCQLLSHLLLHILLFSGPPSAPPVSAPACPPLRSALACALFLSHADDIDMLQRCTNPRVACWHPVSARAPRCAPRSAPCGSACSFAMHRAHSIVTISSASLPHLLHARARPPPLLPTASPNIVLPGFG